MNFKQNKKELGLTSAKVSNLGQFLLIKTIVLLQYMVVVLGDCQFLKRLQMQEENCF
jgi:hypothetical protein